MATATAQTISTDEQTAPVVKFEVIFDKLHSVASVIREIQSELKAASKNFNKVLKSSKKKKSKDDNENKPPRAPSGFAKPTRLSAELCTFLGVSVDTLMARTEVTRKINQYIKDHNLQNAENKREIKPDEKLNALLSTADTPLTYFNLQARIKHHFAKPEASS